MGKKEEKTNVMRILDALKAEYEYFTYDNGQMSAGEIARCIGVDPEALYKTLVCVGKSGQNYVFMVRSEGELDLKKAARAAGEKSMEMIPQKALLPLTGYIHGGCSPIGMKKPFRTTVHHTAADFDTIFFSAGKIGYQVEVAPDALKSVLNYALADVIA